MKKHVKVTLQSTGGEFTFGKIEDEEIKSEILNLIEEEEDINLETSFSDGSNLELFNYTSLYGKYSNIFHDSTKIEVEFTNDENFEEVDYDNESNLTTTVEECDINYFTIENPEISEDDDEDDIYLGGYIEEKRIRFSFGITLEDQEDFEFENLFIGLCNLDETLGDYEIVEKAFYIPKSKQKEILKKIYGENSEESELDPYTISDAFIEEDQELMDLFNQFEIQQVGEVEGKGESETIYTFVFDNDLNILSENEQY